MMISKASPIRVRWYFVIYLVKCLFSCAVAEPRLAALKISIYVLIYIFVGPCGVWFATALWPHWKQRVSQFVCRHSPFLVKALVVRAVWPALRACAFLHVFFPLACWLVGQNTPEDLLRCSGDRERIWAWRISDINKSGLYSICILYL